MTASPLFSIGAKAQTPLRDAITAATRRPEPDCVAALIGPASLSPEGAAKAAGIARELVTRLRAKASHSGVEGLIHEYSLSSQEGVALMCLAEALLRIPDSATRDALIRDKIATGDWRAHLGHSPSLFVNAATWGLVVTGRLVATTNETSLSGALTRLIGRGGEPVIRKGVDLAMRMMGEQFVTGQTIAEALSNSRAMEGRGFRYSYDMLGEAATTAEDAARYLADYETAIHAIGKASAGRGIYEGPGISIKLSALHPRYARAKIGRVMGELLPRVRGLALLARQYDIGLNIDAEEADRLEISLDLLEALALDPDLAGWNGIGFVIQAYGRRCPFVIDWIVDLARRSERRIMVRLVKGAYWDSEIKRAQVDGQPDFPVFTRKVHTDVSYLACARKLLAAPDAVFPQFATHNAQTLAAIMVMAGPNFYRGQYEFQCLHGMGEPLYSEVVGNPQWDRPCRIYAPVGTHETLLAYLVRRLLENGANSSFVNRIADEAVPVEELIVDPVAAAKEIVPLGAPHEKIKAPLALYGTRRNAAGLDLADEHRLVDLARALEESAATAWRAEPSIAGHDPSPPGEGESAPADRGGVLPHRGSPHPGSTRRVDSALPSGEGSAGADAASGTLPFHPVLNPADHRDVVGQVRHASAAGIDAALAAATAAAPGWAATPAAQRAAALERAAEAMEARMPVLLGLIVREAGKSYANAIAEVREAVDFLRYYAAEITRLLGAGRHEALGPVVCISPWNFPLAIFTGQVAAALAAGNPVLAKPAEETPLVAAEAVRLLHAAGIPADVLQLVPGAGETGAALVGDPRVMAVMFTGSTAVARLIQGQLADRLTPGGQPIPLIAETGGQNALVVDSSALAEQVVGDVIASAFDSAGQRCSALRILCLQEDVAERSLAMLKGALRELALGNPAQLSTDIGPVITAEARDGILAHIETMRARGHRVESLPLPEDAGHGTFVPPTIIEIGAIADVEREVFGPVLHVLRYKRSELDALIGAINDTGYGLTFGLHTRIDETIARVTGKVEAGNLYVNRNIIGAVVGVQPFGGSGLSGTGPKAGGPLYLGRLLPHPPQPLLDGLDASGSALAPARAYAAWLQGLGRHREAEACIGFLSRSPLGASVELSGPVGERNLYTLGPRGRIAALAETESGLLIQIGAILATGNIAVLPVEATGGTLAEDLPADLSRQVERSGDWFSHPGLRGLLYEGENAALTALLQRLSGRKGAILQVQSTLAGGTDYDLTRLLEERSISTNTAAAGGNASLMSIG
ncbi:trifunctional transcriptional regulator/proline dehydrogenase/L-glutamate gamma-semialdehyde dehydrogenase [Enterovirga rhinocerotis]|uniref:Bifunctional protein PutA n=1 Tax=Enterovirga rhinocerotis TaxID=1339210 RepID=A0A4R7C4E1_9HYPH|nr:trifunctional transcriptional regulator/proline dehydrogenase/L-glutamate gamma-semialdehyde dehydrogenase [Enterovirga rhinocerotis]TDR93354.1 L-proline dehydrogenase /delta-1-pyrroline-5-carboxylate dehydrogenase [Enterovirga rhinocerotis]